MIRSARVIAGVAAVALVASACGGPAVAPVVSAPAPTSATTAAATATRQVVGATAQGATVARFDNKLVITDAAAPDLPAGNYTSTVQIVTLEKGGRSVAHMHGGIESIYVLQGTIDFRLAGGTRVFLTPGQGAVVPPGTVLQAINAGDATAKFLAFMMTAETATFQTNVDQAP